MFSFDATELSVFCTMCVDMNHIFCMSGHWNGSERIRTRGVVSCFRTQIAFFTCLLYVVPVLLMTALGIRISLSIGFTDLEAPHK